MEFRVLRYFLAVVKEESISKAAEFLHITQPTLSRQLMELEEKLGTKLFNRGKRNHKISLTDEGILLYKRAEEILTLVNKTKSEFATSETMIGGELYIGGGETDAMRLIAKTARDLQNDYPYIRYHIFSGNAEDVSEKLDKGVLDFGILIGMADMTKYNYIQLPITDHWGLLMRKDSPLANNRVICPKDLNGLPVIFSRQALAHNELAGWYGSGFEQLNIVATYNLIYNASLMVEAGFGYALGLDKLINITGESQLCFKPFEPPLTANVNIVWKKKRTFSKAAEIFLSQLKNNL